MAGGIKVNEAISAAALGKVVNEIKSIILNCTGTFSGKEPFAGLAPNGRKFSTTVMNFYSFDDEGKIVDDVAATGIAGSLQGIGAIP